MVGYFDAIDPDRTDHLETMMYARSAIEETIICQWFDGSIFSNLIQNRLKNVQCKIENEIQELLNKEER